MARTYHHDPKRFHPWKNPRCEREPLRRQKEAEARRWNVYPFARDWLGFYYCDYAWAGPRWFRTMMMDRPARRQAKKLEREIQKSRPVDYESDRFAIWPHARKPVDYWH